MRKVLKDLDNGTPQEFAHGLLAAAHEVARVAVNVPQDMYSEAAKNADRAWRSIARQLADLDGGTLLLLAGGFLTTVASTIESKVARLEEEQATEEGMPEGVNWQKTA